MQLYFYTPDEISMMLSERLKQQRLNQNLTQAQLAERAGVGLSTVARIESGRGGTLDNVIRMAIALGRINDFSALFEYTPQTIDDVIEQRTPRQRASGKTKSNT